MTAAVDDRTVIDRFRRRVEEQPTRPALRYHDGDDWRVLTWAEYGTRVEELAAALIALGIEAGDRVALLSGNRPEWHVADLAIMSIGAVTVPVYPTSSSSQVAYVLADSAARVCIADGESQIAKILLHLSELSDLERIVGLSELPGLDRDEVLLGLDRMRATGRRLLDDDPEVVRRRVEQISLDAVASLVYTSGTTGPPKGAVLTHGNLSWIAGSVESMIGLGPDERFLSYLPLSHIAERVTSHIGQIVSGGQTWFARSLATVPEDLRSCRPTIFFAVPRVWQKLHDAILDRLEQRSGAVQRAFAALVSAGSAVVDADQSGGRAALRPRLQRSVLDRVLGVRIRTELGLDHARLVVSSAAPIHPDLVRWFHAIGLPIAEVWGQTEDCGPATLNPPGAIRIGTVGRPLPGVEVRAAADGELLVRAGSVCRGYHDRPSESAALIDHEGWMATGDLGSVDDDGYVRITGRKKDLIITAAGQNIAPAEIESRLSMEPLIGQAVVLGDGRKYLVALLTLDPDEIVDWATAHGTFAEAEALIADPALQAAVAAAVERVNRQHARVEQIKRWRLLPETLTVEGGALTPTMKVKRDVVAHRHADLVAEMYADDTR
jgi:long-chain acyl-CoA synthetase